MWVQSQCQEDNLQEEMATYSRTLAWRIPWTEEPGRLQSLVLQRCEHDCACMHTEKLFWWNIYILNLKKSVCVCVCVCIIHFAILAMQQS